MRQSLILIGAALLLLGGCEKHAPANFASLDNSGMWSTSLDEVKKLKPSDQEIGQLTKLKQASASDDLCLALMKSARARQLEFTSADSAIQLSQAGFADPQILEMARSGQIDILSGDAVTLKLIGLSGPTVQEILHRRMKGLPTPTSEQIGRLKNTAMSERQILEFINQGNSDQTIEKYIRQREAVRNHSNTSFTRQSRRR